MAKVLISIDDALLKRIDQQAQQRGMTRSGFIAELAHDRLSVPVRRAPAAIQSIRRAQIACRAAAKDVDATDLVRGMRDAR